MHARPTTRPHHGKPTKTNTPQDLAADRAALEAAATAAGLGGAPSSSASSGTAPEPAAEQQAPAAPATRGRRRSGSRGSAAEVGGGASSSAVALSLSLSFPPPTLPTGLSGSGSGGPTVLASGVLALLPEAPVHAAVANGMLVRLFTYTPGAAAVGKAGILPFVLLVPPTRHDTLSLLTQGADPEAVLKAQAQYIRRVLLVDWLLGWLAALLKGE